MDFLVCIKQVPDTTEVKIDPQTNTFIRQGVPSIVNPFFFSHTHHTFTMLQFIITWAA